MSYRRLFRIAVLLGVVVSIGCSSNKPSPDKIKLENVQVPTTRPNKPSIIYVEDFDLGDATITDNSPGLLPLRSSSDPVKRLQEIGNLLSDSIVKQLNKDHHKAQRITRDAPKPTTGWIIAGAVLSADEGNRLQRAIVGFGAGESKAALYVAVTDLTQHSGQAFLTMNVESQSGHNPGAVVTLSPFAAAAKFAMGKNASDDDIKRAGEEIAKSIEKYAEDPAPDPAK